MFFFFVVIHIKSCVFTFSFLEILSKHFSFSIDTKTLAHYRIPNSIQLIALHPFTHLIRQTFNCLAVTDACSISGIISLIIHQDYKSNITGSPSSSSWFPRGGIWILFLPFSAPLFILLLLELSGAMYLFGNIWTSFVLFQPYSSREQDACSVNFVATPGKHGSLPGKPPQACTALSRWLSLKNSGVQDQQTLFLNSSKAMSSNLASISNKKKVCVIT